MLTTLQGGDYIQRYVIDYNLKNGLGRPAVSLYLTGCDKPLKCKGCHNWELIQRPEKSPSVDDIKIEIDKQVKNFLVFHSVLRVAILGGDPLTEYNREITWEISKFIKEKYPDSILILYSWRDISNLQQRTMQRYVEYMDYGVLGGWEESLFIEKRLPASTNQYIYDFKNKQKHNAIKIK